jgi:phospholipase C
VSGYPVEQSPDPNPIADREEQLVLQLSRNRRRYTGAALLVGASVAVAATTLSAGASTAPTHKSHAVTTSPIRHFVVIPEENHAESAIIGSSAAPYINSLAKTYGLATNYQAGDPVADHSLPSYLMFTEGTTGTGVNGSDCGPTSCPQSGPNIFQQVQSAGLTWKGYAESMPSNCDLASKAGAYAARHAPAVYFTDVRTTCAKNDVPLGTTSSGALASDLKAGNLPNYSIVTPNLNDDMHDGTVQQGDAWLAKWMPIMLHSPNYLKGDTAIVITWDEGSSGTNNVATIVISPYTLKIQNSTAFTHYSLLRTAEDLLGLPALNGAKTATSMVSAFKL